MPAPLHVERLQTPRTARLVSLAGREPADVRYVWLCCHGYGMAVEAFARWFEALPAHHQAYCPEGLSRFYWGGFDGKPVASWMTRAERLCEIDDFTGWMDRVYRRVRGLHPGARVVLLGFSQGAATVMRWTQRGRPPFAHLVLWSGTPPEDIEYAPRDYYAAEKLHARWGDADELVPWSRARERFAEVGLPFEHQSFAGGHRMTGGALLALAAEIERRDRGGA